MATSRNMINPSFYVLFMLLHYWLQLAASSLVNRLPGFQGPLPFHFETGYIGVGESEDVQLFYYFVKSERNATEDPLVFWLTGGPGCSGFSGLVFEIGPLNFKVVEYNGSLPTLVYNPYSWTKVSSIIFMDLPVGTGYSYGRTARAFHSSDYLSVSHADEFLRRWLKDHPEFISNPLYVGGDSYSGLTVPAIGKHISDANEAGSTPPINLKGALVGNPSTDSTVDYNSRVPYAHRVGLISDELYQLLKNSCGNNYFNPDPSNTECTKNVMKYYQCTFAINPVHILEPICGFASPRPEQMLNKRRSLYRDYVHLDQILPTIGCRNYAYLLCKYWMDDKNVRKALDIREGSIGQWLRCNYGISYETNIQSSTEYHAYLGKKGYRILVYSGDHDMTVPYVGTQEWIRSLNYSIVDDWRPWWLNYQIAGYTRTYSNRLTFATLKVTEGIYSLPLFSFPVIISGPSGFCREQVTPLQSTRDLRLWPCTQGGYLRSLFNYVFSASTQTLESEYRFRDIIGNS
ncbi:hypothetical protein K2173_028472 [Erythroxylum novogranatense]|uniref:Serine carboxypeptidase-like 7 n=1 Tax=Erythroxylum novogranatense TaxID=1862640 RepID=A0AAV8U5Q4_9ROSI|nr:hypothetical protein K2173_028472 [Erythroxylum novogranatense]